MIKLNSAKSSSADNTGKTHQCKNINSTFIPLILQFNSNNHIVYRPVCVWVYKCVFVCVCVKVWLCLYMRQVS